MAKKDKFAQMDQSMGTSSFTDSLVKAASTVAAIEQRNETAATEKPKTEKPAVKPTASSSSSSSQSGAVRYTHLPNPSISIREYNLASQYCSNFDNMTRQDWMELAIIEKLYHDGLIPKDEFNARNKEIRNRPPRGQRKNTKARSSK